MQQMANVRTLLLSGIKERLGVWRNGNESAALTALSGYKHRFLLWWNGDGASESTAQWVLASPSQMRTADAPHAKKQDVSARLIVSQALWGEGNLSPGPADFVAKLVNLLRLTPEMSMVDLGAGLGGPSRAISAAYGVWVTAYEWEAEIAQAGNEQSIMHGMGRKVPIVHLDPDTIDRPVRKIDCFFSKDALHLVDKKKELLLAVKAALKPNGQFFIIDYLVTKQGESSPRIAAWNAADEQVSHFWSKEEYAAALTGMKLDLRVTEDMTSQYCEMIAEGFRQLKNAMEGLIAAETDPGRQSDLRHALAFESNRWAVRADAMQAGDIAVVRFTGAIPH